MRLLQLGFERIPNGKGLALEKIMNKIVCRNLLVFLFIMTAAVLIFGCSVDKISKENFDQIKTGMTETEVQAILGPPTESKGVDVTVFSGTTSIWKKGDTVISIQFVNRKVVAKQFSKAPQTAK
jgi:outer membrane protein assembly factor BamE (lipoprotein component of BamABCDE complex)